MKVMGPNGLVLDFPAIIAEGMVASPSGAYRFVVDVPAVKVVKKSSTKE